MSRHVIEFNDTFELSGTSSAAESSGLRHPDSIKDQAHSTSLSAPCSLDPRSEPSSAIANSDGSIATDSDVSMHGDAAQNLAERWKEVDRKSVV